MGDYIARGGAVGIVRACCADGLDLYVVVDKLRANRELSAHSIEVHTAGSVREVWPADELVERAAWQRISLGTTVVVRM